MARKRHSNSHRGGPCAEMERVLPSKVAAISPFVDKLMLLIKSADALLETRLTLKSRCARHWRMPSFTEIMKTLASTFTLVAAAKLRRKFRSSSKMKEKDLTATRYRTLPPQGLLN